MLRSIRLIFFLLFIGIPAMPALAQVAVNAPALSTIVISNSAKDIEIHVANLLKQQLNLDSALSLVDDSAEDLRLRLNFVEDETRKIPRLLIQIDTTVLVQDEDGQAISQSISIAAAADISFPDSEITKLLQWTNAWNSRILPVRVFVSGNQLLTATSVLITESEPVTEERVLGSFLGVVRAWPAILRDLETNGLTYE